MSSLLVVVIGQVDINRELVSLLSTGPLASYCTFINEIILCYVIFYDANKLVIHSFNNAWSITVINKKLRYRDEHNASVVGVLYDISREKIC